MAIETTQESRQSETGNQAEPRAHKRTWIRVIVYLAVVGGMGFAGWGIYQNQQAAKTQASNQAAALLSRPVPVQVTRVMQRPMPSCLTALGTVTPYMAVTVKARVNGQLEPVKFTEGQQVRQGETISVIDPRPYKAALDPAK